MGGDSQPLVPVSRFRGELSLPGDKSIGHRALLLAALSDGSSVVSGLSAGDDLRRTHQALECMGVAIERLSPTSCRISGVGLRGLTPPEGALDCGNSGTTMRLLAGVLAGQGWPVTMTGDASLMRRPMQRIRDPLRQMGAQIGGPHDGARGPLHIVGCQPLRGIHHRSSKASAQVKSCLLLAGLYAVGETAVTEPFRSRDHTERMLMRRGVSLRVEGRTVAVTGPLEGLEALDVEVPGDPSSAAFFLAAAAIIDDSHLVIRGVCSNPTRTGFLDCLERMGAELQREEDEGALTLRGGRTLRAIDIGGEDVVRCLDELPLVALLAARAEGVSQIRDAAELRVKESDRLRSTAQLLTSLGIDVQERADGLSIRGRPERPFSAFRSHTAGDHRLVMTAAVAALAADGECHVGPSEEVKTSFPEFWEHLKELTQR